MTKRHPHAALPNAESNKFLKSLNSKSSTNTNFIAGPNQAALETSQSPIMAAPQELATATGEPREVTQQASAFRSIIPADQTNPSEMEISTHPSLDNSADQTGINAHAETFPSTNGLGEHLQDPSANLPQLNNQPFIDNSANQLGINAHAETFPRINGLGEQHHQDPSANLPQFNN